MALLFGLAGFFSNPMLMFIALFVWIGAARGQHGTNEIRPGEIPVSAAMMTSFETVAPGDSLEFEPTQLILSGSTDFPVIDSDHVVGVITRDGLIKALAQKDRPLCETSCTGISHWPMRPTC